MFKCPLDGKSFDETRSTVCPQCGTDYTTYFQVKKLRSVLTGSTKKHRINIIWVAALSAIGAAVIVIIIGKFTGEPPATLKTHDVIGHETSYPTSSITSVEATLGQSGEGVSLIKATPIPETSPLAVIAVEPSPTPIRPPATPCPTTTSLPPVEIVKVPELPERVHEVQPGENLSIIAIKYYGAGNKFQIIIKANRDTYPELERNPDSIRPFWKLRIPYPDKEGE